MEKLVADEIVFGSNAINFHGWNYGITDLVTEIAESKSPLVKPKVSDYERLRDTILKNSPTVAILMLKKVTDKFLKYMDEPKVNANHGKMGKIIDNCPTMFYSVAFPHVNSIPSKEKVEKYKEVKEYLLRLEEIRDCVC